LAEHEIVGTEKITECTGLDGVHGAGLKIYQNRSRNIFSTRGLKQSNQFGKRCVKKTYFVKVDI
jgi:hypothetical protein